jgi:alpha-ketoglutarate-dependent taurine dioxygenase
MKLSDWRERLAVAGYVVVPRVALDEDNAALRALGAALGVASATGITPGQPNVEQHGINRVEAMDLPRIDPGGRTVLSTSADDFPLHTDDTFARSPVRSVLMHCWQADAAGGGVSRVAHVADILAGLAPATVERLRLPDFPSPFGPAPVLFEPEAGDHAGPCIRFNHRDFVSYGERYGPALAPDQLAALDQVLAAANACVREMMLSREDCLVVDNRRVLHGRSAFSPRSGRLLKRLRVA